VEIARQQATAALDKLAQAVAILDDRGIVAFHNRALAAHLQRGDLTLVQGRLGVRHGDGTMRLRAAIEDAIATASGKDGVAGTTGGMAIRIARPNQAALTAIVVPLSAAAPLSARGKPGALVVFGDPEAPSGLLGRHLAQIYGLSGAEAALALDLLHGLSPAEAAAKRGVAISTVRTQLANTLTKTGAKRQSDLIRLVAAIPALKSDNKT